MSQDRIQKTAKTAILLYALIWAVLMLPVSLGGLLTLLFVALNVVVTRALMLVKKELAKKVQTALVYPFNWCVNRAEGLSRWCDFDTIADFFSDLEPPFMAPLD